MTRHDLKILGFLGFNTTGDLGPYTLYTRYNGALVYYARTPALNPASPAQQLQRAKWTAAAKGWHDSAAEVKHRWERITRATSAKLTGYNLFIYWATTEDAATVRTMARQAGELSPL